MSQQASPEPKNWTIAYRKPRANRFVRAANWSGSWAGAVELSGRFGELHPGLQIFYVPARQAELDGYVTVEDIANILTDSGKRIRVVEGELAAEDLAAMISPEADEAHAVLDHGISYDGRSSYPTPPVYLAPRAADSPAAVGDAVIFDQLQAKVIAVYPESKTSPYAKVKIRCQATGATETVARDAVRRDNWDRIQVLKSVRDSETGWTAEQETEFYDLLGDRYDRDGSRNLRQPRSASAVARDLDEAQHQANQAYLAGEITEATWRVALAAIEDERAAQARRLADETDALITGLAEKYQIDGVPACGAPVDGGRCGRHPGHGDDHPHIKEPGTEIPALGKPLGQMDPGERAAVIRRTAARFQAELQAAARRIAEILDQAEAEEPAQLQTTITRERLRSLPGQPRRAPWIYSYTSPSRQEFRRGDGTPYVIEQGQTVEYGISLSVLKSWLRCKFAGVKITERF